MATWLLVLVGGGIICAVMKGLAEAPPKESSAFDLYLELVAAAEKRSDRTQDRARAKDWRDADGALRAEQRNEDQALSATIRTEDMALRAEQRAEDLDRQKDWREEDIELRAKQRKKDLKRTEDWRTEDQESKENQRFSEEFLTQYVGYTVTLSYEVEDPQDPALKIPVDLQGELLSVGSRASLKVLTGLGSNDWCLERPVVNDLTRVLIH
jgi:hypothetical protein